MKWMEFNCGKVPKREGETEKLQKGGWRPWNRQGRGDACGGLISIWLLKILKEHSRLLSLLPQEHNRLEKRQGPLNGRRMLQSWWYGICHQMMLLLIIFQVLFFIGKQMFRLGKTCCVIFNFELCKVLCRGSWWAAGELALCLCVLLETILETELLSRNGAFALGWDS